MKPREKSPEKRIRSWKWWEYGVYFIYHIILYRIHSTEACRPPCDSAVLYITLYIVLLYTCIWYHLNFKGTEWFVRKRKYSFLKKDNRWRVSLLIPDCTKPWNATISSSYYLSNSKVPSIKVNERQNFLLVISTIHTQAGKLSHKTLVRLEKAKFLYEACSYILNSRWSASSPLSHNEIAHSWHKAVYMSLSPGEHFQAESNSPEGGRWEREFVFMSPGQKYQQKR